MRKRKHSFGGASVAPKRARKLCAQEGCDKRCSFGLPGGKPTHCSDHKTTEMLDVVHKRCAHEGCKKHPNFGVPGEKPTHCAIHKTMEMVNVKNKRCAHEGCKTCPSFGLPGEKPTHCHDHKTTEMLDVRSKRCAHEGCKTRPTFGLEDGNPTHCAIHKAPEMVDVVHQRCAHEGCKTQPSFGLEKGKPTHCGIHKTTDMLDVVNKLCAHEGCKKTQPKFGLQDGKPTHCADHKTQEMADVVNQLCAHVFGDGSRCPVQAKHLKPLCARHDTTQTRRRKSREMAVVDYLKNNPVSAVAMVHNRIEYVERTSTSIRYYYPDVVWVLKRLILQLEIDELQHKPYACEFKRIMDLAQARLEEATLLVRYNPDAMHIDGTPWRWKKADRLKELRRVLAWCMTEAAEQLARDMWATGRVLCIYLFYDDKFCKDEAGMWPGKVQALRVVSALDPDPKCTVYETEDLDWRI